MRNVVCSHCQENVRVPDDLAQAHCVRCGQILEQETHYTTRAPSALTMPEADRYGEGGGSNVAIDLPERYASWEDFRSMSPAIQRELLHMAGRAMPDLRSQRPLPIPESAPKEMDGWSKPLGSMRIGGAPLPWASIGFLLVGLGLLMVAGALSVLFAPHREVVQPKRDISPLLALLFVGVGGTVLGGYLGLLHPARAVAMLWIFEEGILLMLHGRSTAVRWEHIHEYEVRKQDGSPVHCLTLAQDVFVKVALVNSPEMIPLMEYIEIRLSSAQFLHRLKAIWLGQREPFGVVALDRLGFTGPTFFASWADVRKVVTDAKTLFVDVVYQKDWFPIRCTDVSFPSLVIAVAAVLIDEHGRLAPVDA